MTFALTSKAGGDTGEYKGSPICEEAIVPNEVHLYSRVYWSDDSDVNHLGSNPPFDVMYSGSSFPITSDRAS